MPKVLIKFLDDLSPSQFKLRDLPRKPDGLYNLAFNEYGQEVKRAGYSEYNVTSIGPAHKIVGMHRFYRQNTAIKGFFVAWDEGIYILSDTSPHGATLIKPGLTADSDTYFADFANHCYFVNGVDGLFKCTLTDEIAGTRTSDTVFTRTAGTWSVDSLIGQYVFSYVNTDATAGKWTIITDNDADTVTISGTLYAGADRIKISTVRTVGITAPGAPTDETTRPAGELSEGVYKFCYTFVDEDGYESNGGTASDDITVGVGDNGIRIDIAVSDDDKVTKRRIYRTTVGGSIYYYDGEVNNVVLVYNSILSDAVISLKSVLHTDHNAPPDSPDLVVKRLSRVNIAVNDDLYVSKNYDKTTGVRSVEYFPAYNYFPTGNGQNITGLMEQLGGLPVFTENTIERLVGTDEDNFELRNAHQEDGCIAKRSVVNCKNYVVYLAFNGIYIFDGVSARAIDVALGGRLNKYIKDNINYIYADLSCATYYENKYLLCIPTGESETPNVTIYFDFETKSYGVCSFAFSCFSKWDKGGDGLSLKGGSNTIGRVYSVFSGLDDDGSAITAYDDIEPLDFGRPEVYKQWYSIFIKIKTTSGTALAMYYALDDNTETSSIMVSRDDIAFVDGGTGADTITTVAGDFVAAGFKAGDVIVITGTDSNDGNMTIVSVVAKTITLATGIVTAEAAGDAILTKAKVLTADTTKWYRISLGSGGKCARALKPRPYMSDKYSFEIHGLAVCYDEEPFAEEKE